MGARAGQGRQACITWNLPARPLYFTDGERGPKMGDGLNAPKTRSNRVCSEQKGSALPRKRLLSLWLPVEVRRHWGVLSSCVPAPCVSVYLSVCPSAPVLSPRALEGAASLSGRARLSSSYVCTQLWEPGWPGWWPGGRDGVGNKELPQFSVIVPTAHTIKLGNETKSTWCPLETSQTISPPSIPQGHLKGGPLRLAKRKENRHSPHNSTSFWEQ